MSDIFPVQLNKSGWSWPFSSSQSVGTLKKVARGLVESLPDPAHSMPAFLIVTTD